MGAPSLLLRKESGGGGHFSEGGPPFSRDGVPRSRGRGAGEWERSLSLCLLGKSWVAKALPRLVDRFHFVFDSDRDNWCSVEAAHAD